MSLPRPLESRVELWSDCSFRTSHTCSENPRSCYSLQDELQTPWPDRDPFKPRFLSLISLRCSLCPPPDYLSLFCTVEKTVARDHVLLPSLSQHLLPSTLPPPQEKCWSLPFICHLTKFHLPSQTEASFPLRSPLCFLLHRPEAPSHLFMSTLAVNFGLSDYLSYESFPELHCLDLCILAARKMSRI